jgi:DNA-binding LacI/PurR family transcriptional regulator
MAVTIKDIARKLKVSHTTVSRALRDDPRISKKTKEKVLKIAKEVGYVPNVIARELSLKESRTIGFIYSSVEKNCLEPIIQGVEDIVSKEQYQLLSFNSKEDVGTEYKYLRFLHERRVDGILLWPVTTEEGSNLDYIKFLLHNNIPVVMVDRYFKEIETDYVVSDNFKGAYQAISHLIRLGHKKIGYISGHRFLTSVYDRLEGYKKALEDCGIEFDKRLVKEIDPIPVTSIEQSYEAMKELLRENNITAILAYNEISTVGALKAIREEGIKIPEELAFVGFDEVAIVSQVLIPLTVVTQQTYQIGEIAAEILIEKLRKGKNNKAHVSEIRHVVVKPELIVRESCGVCVA